MTALMWDGYEVQEIRSMRDIREIFAPGFDSRLNWIFCSTAGRHGSYKSLDQIEAIIRGQDTETAPFENGKYTASILVLHPRLCILKYGEIQVGLQDIKLLRELISTTLEAIVNSQEGNV